MVESTGKNRSLILEQLRTPQVSEEHTYQAKLRAAAVKRVRTEDLDEIVSGIVERAKRGDKVAIDQVFHQLLGVGQRPATVVNNLVVKDVETAARLSRRVNGSPARITGGDDEG